MAVASLLALAVAYGALWQLGLFSGLGFHGTVAAVLGVLLASAVGVGLMALLFHSNRTRHDQQVHDAARRKRSRDTN